MNCLALLWVEVILNVWTGFSPELQRREIFKLTLCPFLTMGGFNASFLLKLP